jgi:hypothetical protein
MLDGQDAKVKQVKQSTKKAAKITVNRLRIKITAPFPIVTCFLIMNILLNLCVSLVKNSCINHEFSRTRREKNNPFESAKQYKKNCNRNGCK